MKCYLYCFVILSCFHVCRAQEYPVMNSSLRIGVGGIFMSTEDRTAFSLMGEHDFYHNDRSESTISVVIGSSDEFNGTNVSYIQLNANTYFVPIRKTPGALRFGTGLSLLRVHEARDIVLPPDTFQSRRSVGINLIIEYSLSLSPKQFLSLCTYLQAYYNDDRHLGLMLKYGIGS